MGTTVRPESHFPKEGKNVRRKTHDARFMLAEIGGNAFGVGTDTSGKEEEEEEEEEERGTLGWSSHITLPGPTPVRVRPSETILATLNALMVECTESRAEADLPTDAVADGSDSTDSNAQTEQRRVY